MFIVGNGLAIDFGDLAVAEEHSIGGIMYFHEDEYDPKEVEEIEDMINRVLVAWHKRREFMRDNPVNQGRLN